MSTQRHAKGNWTFPTTQAGKIEKWEYVQIAVLMDIRDELQTLNRLLGCHNFVQIPTVLRSIQENTKKRRAATKRTTEAK